jgi:hypothetical protein
MEVCLLCSVDTGGGGGVFCVLLVRGGLFLVFCCYMGGCLLCSVDTGRCVYCVLLIQGSMFMVFC